MSVKITYFVHGTTTDNEKDLATGWQPGELSELGKKQAVELGGLVADQKFDAVFCSNLKRAINSVRLGFGNKYEIIEDKRLREINYGDFTGRASGEFKDRLNEYVGKPFPNGESYNDVERRLADFVEYLKNNFRDKHIAIIAHQAPQLALEVLLKNKTWEQAIAQDWRHKKIWQPGWAYEIKD